MGLVKINIAIVISGVMMCMLMMVAEGSPDTSIKEWRCNVDSYSASDAYAANVEYIFGVLVSTTHNVYYYNTQSPGDTDICYGLETCTSALTTDDCSVCVAAARDAVKEICAFKIGGFVEMADCTIRYENYYF